MSEYRETQAAQGRSAARLLQTAPPKDEEALMAAATQVGAALRGAPCPRLWVRDQTDDKQTNIKNKQTKKQNQSGCWWGHCGVG